MKLETLESQIKKRAEQKVQARIIDFQRFCIIEALKLFGETNMPPPNFDPRGWLTSRPLLQKCFAVLASKTPSKGWPKEIWEKEQDSLTKEILSRMDELQRTLLAKELRPEEIVAEPEEGENQ